MRSRFGLVAVCAVAIACVWFGWASGSLSRRSPAPVAVPDAGEPALPTGAAISVAAVLCHNSLGTGFFVGDGMLLTNAHVVCRDGEEPHVLLSDGRLTRAEVVRVDTWLDLALLKVADAETRALPIADAALLSPGAPAFLVPAIGAMHPVHVRAVGRNHLGMALLQFDGPVQPGDSGSPLLDASGRAVGVVSMLAFDAQGMGLAVPTNYAATSGLIDGAASADSEDWRALLACVGQSDERERDNFRKRLDHPGLVQARIEADGSATAVLLARWPDGRPEPMEASLVVRREGRLYCRQLVHVTRWAPLADDAAAIPGSRLLRWIVGHHLERDLFLGETTVESSCIPKLRRQGLELDLEEGDARAWRVDLQ